MTGGVHRRDGRATPTPLPARPPPRSSPAVILPCPAPARPAAPAPAAHAPAAHAPAARADRPSLAGPLVERSFVAADGRHWRVREHVVRTDDGDARRRLLLFECRHVLRWLRDFPHDWHRRSDAELEALSWTV